MDGKTRSSSNERKIKDVNNTDGNDPIIFSNRKVRLFWYIFNAFNIIFQVLEIPHFNNSHFGKEKKRSMDCIIFITFSGKQTPIPSHSYIFIWLKPSMWIVMVKHSSSLL